MSVIVCLLSGCIALFFTDSARVGAQISPNRVIDSVRANDTSEGTIVSIAENPLRTYVTRQKDDRFQLIIPRAAGSVSEGYIYSGRSVIVQAENKEGDAVFSFDLLQGSTVALKQYKDKLDVLITPPRGSSSAPAVVAANSSSANKTETPLKTNVETTAAADRTPQVVAPRIAAPQAANTAAAVTSNANTVVKSPDPEKKAPDETKNTNTSNLTSQAHLPPSPVRTGNTTTTSPPPTVRSAKKGVLTGQVVDVNEAIILGASVSLVNEQGVEKTFVTNQEGQYSFADLEPGVYSLRATATGFEPFEVTQITVGAGRAEKLNVKLDVGQSKSEVTITAESPLKSGLTTRVLRGKDLDMLPNTPGGLRAALRALTMRSAGPQGPQILVDGFSGGRLPPKDSIREIRINENPFSAEYSQMGLGRIEIFTKPGTEDFHVNGFFNFNDESLNSRNPFADTRTPFQSRLYGGNVSGPLASKRSSFFLDFERQEIDDNALINATVLDPAFNIIPFNRSLVVPQRRTSFSPRLDYQIDTNNTLVARYSYTRNRILGEKVGDFSLPERAVNSYNVEHNFQLTETAVLGPTMVNETRFQYVRQRNRQEGNDSLPVIRVPEAFIGGGSDFARSLRNEDFGELQNYTTWTRGKHDLKFGGKFRWTHLGEYAPENFTGTYTFGGGAAPRIDGRGQVVFDPATGLPDMTSITGIERYRRTLLLRGLGLSPEDVRALGGGATQFSIAAGEPEAEVSQKEVGVFVQDDWQLRPNFTLSSGLRYEAQSNVGRNMNFAPRLSFAWAPGNGSNPKTVIRGGFGLFYDRFSEDYTLEATRFNGLNQQQFIVSDPRLLDLYPLSPSPADLAAFALPQTVRRVAGGLRAPYSTQLSFSLERQLPHNFSFAATFINTNTFHLLRSRNVNAPFAAGDEATRPIPGLGEIFQYESSGRFRQNQLILNTAYNGEKLNFYATYLLSRARSDSEGAESFPAYQYDLAGEYGRSGLDTRHQLYLGGWISAPWGIYLNPLIFYRSGAPFNIITGRDTNGDRLFTERPAFATDITRASVVFTPFGAFDLDPVSGQEIIPRNYGQGSDFLSVNLGVSKTITFFNAEADSKNAPASKTRRPFSITFSLQFENLLNRTNPGLPVGNLSSPLFGRSYMSAGPYGLGSNPGGNRRIETQITFKYEE